MQERDIQFRGRLPEMLRSDAVDRVGSFCVALRPIDGCVGGTIDDRARRCFANIGEHRLFLRYVKIIATGRDHTHSSFAHLPHELLPKLALGADDENWSAHATTPSRSPRYTPDRMRSHQLLLLRYQATVL